MKIKRCQKLVNKIVLKQESKMITMIIFTWEHDGKQLLGVWWCPQLQVKKSYDMCEIENSQIVGSFSQ